MKFAKDYSNLAVLLVLTFLTFSNIFHNQFVMDDFDFIVDWPLIQSWANLPRFFVSYIPPDGQAGVYSPLKTLFHALSYHCFGLKPFGYHVVSLLVHLISIIFVYRICLFLAKSSWIAFAASLLFALHPVQVEAITYLTASVDMIGVLFLFIAFDLYIRGDEKGRRRLPLVFAALAIFTHELTIALPVLFLWYDVCLRPGQEKWLTNAQRVLPYFILALFYVLAKFAVLGSISRGGYLYESFYLTMLVIVKALLEYIWICFVSVTLTVNHIISDGIFSYGPEDFDRAAVLSQSILDTQVFAAVIVLGIIGYFMVRYFKEKPLVSFCLGWFFLSLLPVSNIVPSGIYFGERYLYPGLLGFCLWAALWLEKICQPGKAGGLSRRAGLGILLLIIAFYSGRTYLRNQDWKNEITFYELAVRENPQSAFMRRDLAIIYLSQGQVPQAAKTLEQAILLKRDDADLFFTLANVYLTLTEYEEAKAALQEAIRLQPEFPEAYYNLAGLYAQEEKKQEARTHLNKALELYRRQGKFLEAYEGNQAFRSYFSSI